jgi:hypothetical protein
VDGNRRRPIDLYGVRMSGLLVPDADRPVYSEV